MTAEIMRPSVSEPQYAAPSPSPVVIVATRALHGFAAGLVATAAMSAVMLGAQRAGLLGRAPPRKIVSRTLRVLRLPHRTSATTDKVVATVAHFAFGGIAGAIFGVARPRRAPLVTGLAYGTAIWASSYAGWAPKLQLMPKARHDRAGRPTVMVIAHWVFGAVLAKLVVR